MSKLSQINPCMSLFLAFIYLYVFLSLPLYICVSCEKATLQKFAGKCRLTYLRLCHHDCTKLKSLINFVNFILTPQKQNYRENKPYMGDKQQPLLLPLINKKVRAFGLFPGNFRKFQDSYSLEVLQVYSTFCKDMNRARILVLQRSEDENIGEKHRLQSPKKTGAC